MVREIWKTRASILLMAVSHSWTRYSSTSAPWLLGWVICFSFGYHTIFISSILVLGKLCQVHLVSSVCSREVLQLISATILLSLHFMTSFPDLVPCQQHSNHFFSIIMLVSCPLWGIHQGLPTIGFFLSTSTNHPRSLLRNTLGTLVLAYINGKVSSLSMIGLHQWPSTERFYVVFNINSFIHTIWFVL